MGKTMDKASVIYGANGAVGLTSVNWKAIETAIEDKIGPEGIMWSPAKKAVEEAKSNKNLVKAYVKVGEVNGDLVLRIKDVRTLVDKEIDTTLVKQYKQKVVAHEKMVALQKDGAKDDKGVVVSLDPKDKVIKPSSESIAKERKLGEDAPLQRKDQTYGDKDKLHTGKVVEDKDLKEKAFSSSNNAPIVILAHGTPLGKVGGGKVHATQFGGKKPSEIVDYLKKSLPVTYSGQVYLDGCYTAAGNTPLNFGSQVYNGMVKAGYFYLQVKGNLGMARTVNGKECVTHAEIEKAYEDAKNEKEKIDKQIPALEKKYSDIDQKINMEMLRLINSAGGRTPKEFTEEEKKKESEIVQKGEENKKARMKDPQLGPLLKRQGELKAIIDHPDYNIEALTGTWGPEKLPPK